MRDYDMNEPLYPPDERRNWVKIEGQWVEMERAVFYQVGENIKKRMTSREVHEFQGGNNVPRGTLLKVKGNKKKIKCLSRASLMNMGFLLGEELREVPWRTLVTLTYHHIPRDGERVKKDLDVYMKKMWRGVPSVWVMEFQRRGSVHFHVILSSGVTEEPMGRRRKFYRDTSRLHSNIWARIGGQSAKAGEVSVRVEPIGYEGAMGAYLAKYARKLEQKAVPEVFANCGRFWGARNVKGYRCHWKRHNSKLNPTSAIEWPAKAIACGNDVYFTAFKMKFKQVEKEQDLPMAW